MAPAIVKREGDITFLDADHPAFAAAYIQYAPQRAISGGCSDCGGGPDLSKLARPGGADEILRGG